MLLSKATYIWGLNQANHCDEVLKTQSSDIARSSISQISEDLKEKDFFKLSINKKSIKSSSANAKQTNTCLNIIRPKILLEMYIYRHYTSGSIK